MLVKNKKQKEINIFENVPKISDLLIPDELQEKVDYLKLGYNKFTKISLSNLHIILLKLLLYIKNKV